MKLPDHLFAFQAEAMRELASTQPRALGLPPGAGKSVVAIAAWELLDAFNIMVLCPAIVRADWIAKVQRFAGRTYVIGQRTGHARSIVVRSYEEVNSPGRRSNVLHTMSECDVLILDEAQRLRNLESATTTSVYGAHANGRGLCARARHIWPLSGTLAVNHFGDLYPHLRALAPQLLPQIAGAPMRHQQFMDYFGTIEQGRWSIRVAAMKNVPELRAIIKQFVIQCPQDVMTKQLPPLRIETLHLDESELDWPSYQDFLASDVGKALAEAVASVAHDAMANAIAMQPGEGGDEVSLSEARRVLGELKAPAVARYVRELLESDPQAHVLVFAHHRSVMAMLRDELQDIEPSVRVIDGETSEVKRAAYIHAFQARGPRVLIAGIGTMREGITLTAANRVVFAEASWVPAENYQAICRAWRIGQGRPVLAEYVCINNTLDEAVTNVCARKARQLSELA